MMPPNKILNVSYNVHRQHRHPPRPSTNILHPAPP
jgi:hypothetical protein